MTTRGRKKDGSEKREEETKKKGEKKRNLFFLGVGQDRVTCALCQKGIK
jgi:hypothetical protein